MANNENPYNDVSGSSQNSLQGFVVEGRAVARPGSDAASQEVLHSAGVEPCEDVTIHSILPPPSQEEEALVCLLHNGLGANGPCEFLMDVDSKELEDVDSPPMPH